MALPLLSTLLPGLTLSLPTFPFSLLPPLPTILPSSSIPSHSLTPSLTPSPTPPPLPSSSPPSDTSPDSPDTNVSLPTSTTLPLSPHMPGMGGTVPTTPSLDPTTSSALPSPVAATSHGHGTAAIVGGVAGGIVLILVLFTLALLLFSRRKKSASNFPDDIFVESGAVPPESRMNDGHMHSSHITPFYGQMNDADSAHSISRKGDFEPSAISPRSGMNDSHNFPMAPRAPSTVLSASEPRTSLIDPATALDIMSTTPMTAYQRQALIAILSAATTSNPGTLILPSPTDTGESAAPVSTNVSNTASTAWSDGNTLVTSPYGGILPSGRRDLNWNSLPSPPPYST